jgi:hypothetical protein
MLVSNNMFKKLYFILKSKEMCTIIKCNRHESESGAGPLWSRIRQFVFANPQVLYKTTIIVGTCVFNKPCNINAYKKVIPSYYELDKVSVQ